MDLLASVDEEHGSVGSQLKAGRERLGLSLSDIAAKTRVPTRHLEAIEQSNFDALPGQTYTLGFARSYANAVDMDAAAISEAMRWELARSGHEGYQPPAQNYEPADPARVPSKTLAWTSAAIAAAALAAARTADPANSQAWLLSATLSRRQGKLGEAQTQIERAALLMPVDPEIGLEAGVIAVLGGRDEAARRSWESVIRAAPGSGFAKTAQGYLDQLGPSTAPSGR